MERAPFRYSACIGTMNRSEFPSPGLRPPSPPPKAGERAGRAEVHGKRQADSENAKAPRLPPRFLLFQEDCESVLFGRKGCNTFFLICEFHKATRLEKSF